MSTGAGRGRPALRWRLTTALALCASLVLTGCSDDSAKGSGKPAEPSSSSTSATLSGTATRAAAETAPTPTMSPRPVAEKAPRTPPGKRGKASQRRFARHVMAVWAYGLRTNDAKALTRLSTTERQCDGCRAYTKDLAKRRKQGWSVDSAGLRVRSIRLDQQPGDVTYAKARVDIPQSDSVFRDGSYRNTNKAHRGATFEVLMLHTGKRYRLLAFTIS